MPDIIQLTSKDDSCWQYVHESKKYNSSECVAEDSRTRRRRLQQELSKSLTVLQIKPMVFYPLANQKRLSEIKELLINSLQIVTDKYIEATKRVDPEKMDLINMAAVHEAYQFIVRFIASKNSSNGNPHAGMTLEQMRRRNRKTHVSAAQIDEQKFDFMEMTGIPLDENDLKAKYADEFATAIILTINALKKDTRIESKRPKPKAKAAYIINRKPSVGTVVSTFKEKPMTKLPSRDAGTGGAEDFGRSVNPIPTRGADYAPHITTRPSRFSDLPTSLPSIATLAGTNKIVHNAFSRRRNQKYQELEIK